MADASPTPLDTLSCPVCLDLLKDPVTVPCGHSFCLDCIKDSWSKDDQSGVYSCPLCRHPFSPRPVLNKNTVLAELAENMMKKRLQVSPPAGSGDVECDICTETKLRAVRSCLTCLASYCEAHIQTHYESPALKKHKLVQASMSLQQKICPHHDKLIEVFCRTDQQCVCLLCVMDYHRGHTTFSAAAERAEKQKQLVETQKNFRQRIQQMEKKLPELRLAKENLRRSAQAAVENSEKIFTELIQSIEKRRSEMKERIRTQEKAELDQAEELLKKLEQEIVDLRSRDAELEQLSHTEDHIHFLQRFQFLSAPPRSADLTHIMTNPQFSMEDKKKSVTAVMESVEPDLAKLIYQCGNTTGQWIVSSSTKPAAPQTLELKTREDFKKYSCRLTLDPSTASSQLAVSEWNKKVTVKCQAQNNPDHPKRFDIVQQVLCRESVSAYGYWEVEFISGNFEISVSYKGSIGGYYVCGFNNQSWRLICSSSNFSFKHNNEETKLPVVSSSSRIGVYVDHSAGILAFYSVSDSVMTLLHRVHTTFTQALYPGFGMYAPDNLFTIID